MGWRRGWAAGLLVAAWLAAGAGAGEFKPGEGWVRLFDGQSLEGWKTHGRRRSAWRAEGGTLANPRRSVNLYTARTFQNFKLHVEFKINREGNSGVYLRGRKEVQILDSFGKADDQLRHWDCGGIYSLHAPTTNACKAPGEWQALDITLVGDTVTVVLNGTSVVDGKEVKGATGGELDNKVGQPGPVMLQGDHGPVWFRNLWIKPLP
ncbi:MAG: 3-keto-disaccharide hydrolase [Planctomycetota bacterium]